MTLKQIGNIFKNSFYFLMSLQIVLQVFSVPIKPVYDSSIPVSCLIEKTYNDKNTPKDCSNKNLTGLTFVDKKDLSDSLFTGSTINGVSFAINVTCRRCHFDNTTLNSSASGGYSSFASSFVNCSNFKNALLDNVSFSSAGLQTSPPATTSTYLLCPSQYRTSKASENHNDNFTTTDFTGASLKSASFINTLVDGSINFDCANLDATAFSFSKIYGVNFNVCMDNSKLFQPSFSFAFLENIAIRRGLSESFANEMAQISDTIIEDPNQKAIKFSVNNVNNVTIGKSGQDINISGLGFGVEANEYCTYKSGTSLIGLTCSAQDFCKDPGESGSDFVVCTKCKRCNEVNSTSVTSGILTTVNDLKVIGKNITVHGLDIKNTAGSVDEYWPFYENLPSANSQPIASKQGVINIGDGSTKNITLSGNLGSNVNLLINVTTCKNGQVTKDSLVNSGSAVVNVIATNQDCVP